ncbi:hypothetical protein [Paenibacillus sp. GCM10023250]|uniref:hypothetical protein n=1 Tax=Paenibacillus sp. GCM10023250 TaxID=3252648 RepID=UPI00360B4EA7
MEHKQWAASCFNKVWDLLGKEDRSERDDEEMVHLCHASFWHWSQHEGHTAANISVGYWQLARVYAVIGQGQQALAYAEKCLNVTAEAKLAPFYMAYAYEAQARAYDVLGERERTAAAAAEASRWTEQVTDAESRGWLAADLASIGPRTAAHE